MRPRSLMFVFLFLILLFTTMRAFGQGRATIYGTVTDPSGASIAGAIVTALNGATGQTRTAISSADGSFVLPDLVIGQYGVTAQASGFKTLVQNAVE